MTRKKLEISGIAKVSLTTSDGRLKEIIYMGNQATTTVKHATVQRIVQGAAGLTGVVAIHCYNTNTSSAPGSADVLRFTVSSFGSLSSGATSTGAVSGQTTVTAAVTVSGIALHTASATVTANASDSYAFVGASIVLAANDVFGVTWCLSVQ